MKRYLIIGNSAAGIAAVEALRQRDKESGITVVSDQGYSSYCRCLISYYLAGEITEDKIFYRPQDFYKTNSVILLDEIFYLSYQAIIPAPPWGRALG